MSSSLIQAISFNKTGMGGGRNICTKSRKEVWNYHYPKVAFVSIIVFDVWTSILDVWTEKEYTNVE